MLVPESAEVAGQTVPSAFDTYPQLAEYLPLKQAIDFAVLDAAPDDVKAALDAAFRQAMDSDTVREWAETNHYDLSGASGEETQRVFSDLESSFAYTLHELGATEVDPASLGIEKP